MAAQISLPKVFEERMKLQLGAAYGDFAASLEANAPVSLRTNPFKKSGVISSESVPWCESGRYLAERPNFTLDPLFHAGAYYVQEASSMLLEQAIKQCVHRKNPLILDLCAAPGGKSTHLLTLLNNDGLLVSNEVIRTRANILEENIIKWGYNNAIVTNNDPKDFKVLKGFFDVIVVDAPCSGEGLFRKDQGAVDEWSVPNAELCSLRQQRILHDIWPALKKDGLLIYCTCTYNDEENLGNLKRLKKDYAFETIPLTLGQSWGIKTINEGDLIGYQCYPHTVKGEGFFLSVLRKNDEQPASKLKSKSSLGVPSKVQLQKVSSWLSGGIEKQLMNWNDTLVAYPANWRDLVATLMDTLRVFSVGTRLAAIKHDKLVPAHDVSMSIHLNRGIFSEIDVDIGNAIRFLRRDDADYGTGVRGFTIVTSNNQPLGWINHLGNRANNLYPKEWRIRMQPNQF